MWPPGYICSSPPFSITSLYFTVKPSKPRCYAEGPTQQGKDIVLRCLSSEGTNPLQYSWEKTSDSKLLPASAVLGNWPFPQSLPNKYKTVIKSFTQVCFLFNTAIFSVMCASPSPQILWEAPLTWGMHLPLHLALTAALPAIVLALRNVYCISM